MLKYFDKIEKKFILCTIYNISNQTKQRIL